jgi:hypothetical protein
MVLGHIITVLDIITDRTMGIGGRDIIGLIITVITDRIITATTDRIIDLATTAITGLTTTIGEASLLVPKARGDAGKVGRTLQLMQREMLAVRFGSLADTLRRLSHVRYTPNNRQTQA